VAAEARPRLGYRPALDGARAIAIVSVLGFHAIQRPTGGFLGVHIFFVLSGFLITTLLLEEWNARGSISLAHFYFRRALRLLPALAVALVGFATITMILLETGRAPANLTAHGAEKGALLGVLYVSNIAQAAGTTVPGSIGHLWSLATEEQFYLLWPISLVAVLRAGLSRRTIGIGLAGLIAIVALHRLEMSLRGIPQRRMYFGPDGSFDLLLVGCLAGVFLTSAGPAGLATMRRLCRIAWLPAAVTVGTALLIAQIFDQSLYDGLLLVFGLAVAVLLLHLVLDEDCLLGRLLSLRPLVYIGQISYGIYLWHQIIFALPLGQGYPAAALGVSITVVVASASYRFVEKPFLRRKHRDREQVVTAPVIVAVPATP
jgi:peptidoglycan/LPS O-acetylase OafA/YrhL